MTQQFMFYKDGHQLILTSYNDGLMTLRNENGISFKITKEKIYEILKSHFDHCLDEYKPC